MNTRHIGIENQSKGFLERGDSDEKEKSNLDEGNIGCIGCGGCFNYRAAY